MLLHVEGPISLETVARSILICFNMVSGLEHSFNYIPCESRMQDQYHTDVERHILICVNIVSGLEHSFNYTSCGSGIILHVAGLVSLERVMRHILKYCGYSKLFGTLI